MAETTKLTITYILPGALNAEEAFAYIAEHDVAADFAEIDYDGDDVFRVESE